MNTVQKLRVAVLFGGATHEKETSLDSGRNIVYKLSPQKYDVTPIFVSSSLELFVINSALLVRNSTKEIEQGLDASQRLLWNDLKTKADFVFIGLHGGVGENGGVQGALEMLNIPYNGSSILASALCMDKYKTTQFLRSQGLDVPQSFLIDKLEWEHNKQDILTVLLQTLSLPLIVKPHDDGCSIMVEKITEAHTLSTAIDAIFAQNKTHVMIEEYIVGMELTVGVLGNEAPQALPPSQAVVTGSILSIEEKFLPGAGENQTPAPLPEATLAFVQKTIEHVFVSVGCKGYARIDCFYQTAEQSPTGTERVVIIEVNTLPALTPATCLFHQASEIGLRPMDFIDKIVQLGLEEYERNNHHDCSGQDHHHAHTAQKPSNDLLAH